MVGVEVDDYDVAHEAVHRSPLMRRLWALAARLTGIDFSPVAVRLATVRAPAFVGTGRAGFRRAPSTGPACQTRASTAP
jgi:hypothetical protein